MESPDHLAAKAAEFITTDRILEGLAGRSRDAQVRPNEIHETSLSIKCEAVEKHAPTADRGAAKAKAKKNQK